MTNEYSIREPRDTDAENICRTWRTSIREICGPDYGSDPELLDEWCKHLSIDNIKKIITEPDMLWIVAINQADMVVGLGGLHSSGEIMACYIRPEVLKQGVGSMILARLEDHARKKGHTTVRLNSTITALPFYRRNGYLPDGEKILFLERITAYPMKKTL